MSEENINKSLYDGPLLKTSFRSQSPASYISSSSEDDFNDSCVTVDQSTQLNVDPSIINDLEHQAKIASRHLNKLINFLSGELHKGSDVTLDTVSIYDHTVANVQKDVEKNIRLMYSLVARCEELDSLMKPVAELASQVAEIKNSLDVLEQLCK